MTDTAEDHVADLDTADTNNPTDASALPVLQNLYMG